MVLSKKTFNKKLKGISLIEIILAVGIFAFISLMIGSIYLAYLHLFSDQNSRIEIDTVSRQTLSDMVRNIRQSYTIDQAATDKVLVLDLWPLDPSGNPYNPGCTCYDQIVYKLDPANSSQLIITGSHQGASTRSIPTQRVLASNVTDWSLSYNDANHAIATQVTINLTIAKTTNLKTYTSAQTQKADLRNK